MAKGSSGCKNRAGKALKRQLSVKGSLCTKKPNEKALKSLLSVNGALMSFVHEETS